MSKPVYFEPTISDRSKDFIRRCLKKREEERMSWEEAFNHPLITEGLGSPNLFRNREEKENRTPRQMLVDLK